MPVIFVDVADQFEFAAYKFVFVKINLIFPSVVQVWSSQKLEAVVVVLSQNTILSGDHPGVSSFSLNFIRISLPAEYW